jgi:hypothetical protein
LPHRSQLWNVSTAKAKFSEVLALARAGDPQFVQREGDEEPVMLISLTTIDRFPGAWSNWEVIYGEHGSLHVAHQYRTGCPRTWGNGSLHDSYLEWHGCRVRKAKPARGFPFTMEEPTYGGRTP